MSRIATESFAYGRWHDLTPSDPALVTNIAEATIGGVLCWRISNNGGAAYYYQKFSTGSGGPYNRVYAKADVYVASWFYPNDAASWGFNVRDSSNNMAYAVFGAKTGAGAIGSSNDCAYTAGNRIAFMGYSWPALLTWIRLEAMFKPDSGVGDGEIEVRLDGVPVYSYTGALPISDITEIEFGHYTYSGPEVYVANVIINSDSGSADNTWPGARYLFSRKPNGNGAYSQWLGSDGNSVDNYLLIDAKDTNYVTADDPDLKDTYQFDTATVPVNMEIKRIQIAADMKQASGNARTYKIGVKTNGTEFWTANRQTVGTDFTRDMVEYTTNPQTGSPWTQSELDNIEAGVQT